MFSNVRKMVFIFCLLVWSISVNARTTLARNDIYPIFSTLYTHDYLNQDTKEWRKNRKFHGLHELMQISGSIIAQKANQARDSEKVKVNIGDIDGRWNMIGLLYGSVPTGKTQAATLQTAAAQTFSGSTKTFADSTVTGTAANFGRFSTPIKYSKVGVRFHVSARILENFCFSFDFGAVDIKQTVTKIVNQTTNSVNFSTADEANVNTLIMNKYRTIFDEIGIVFKDFHETHIEDLAFSLAWRRSFGVNEESEDWEPFLFTPFIKGFATLKGADRPNADHPLAVPFGNKGHHSAGVEGGFSLDFYESIELSCAGGATFFFNKTFTNQRVPTSEFQSGIYPYKTDIKVDPGHTWHIDLAIHAHHFLEHLSMYTQYSYISHTKDKVSLVKTDSAFVPKKLEDDSLWKTQLIQTGVNYYISPNLSLGILWQAPLAGRSVYKTNTLLLNICGTF